MTGVRDPEDTRYVVVTWRDYKQRSHAFQPRKRRSACSRVRLEEHEGTNTLPRCAECLKIVRTRTSRPPLSCAEIQRSSEIEWRALNDTEDRACEPSTGPGILIIDEVAEVTAEDFERAREFFKPDPSVIRTLPTHPPGESLYERHN